MCHTLPLRCWAFGRKWSDWSHDIVARAAWHWISCLVENQSLETKSNLGACQAPLFASKKLHVSCVCRRRTDSSRTISADRYKHTAHVYCGMLQSSNQSVKANTDEHHKHHPAISKGLWLCFQTFFSCSIIWTTWSFLLSIFSKGKHYFGTGHFTHFQVLSSEEHIIPTFCPWYPYEKFWLGNVLYVHTHLAEPNSRWAKSTNALICVCIGVPSTQTTSKGYCTKYLSWWCTPQNLAHARSSKV